MTLDWETYKTLCDRGDVLSRFLLTETVSILDAAGEREAAEQLRVVLAGVPLPKPPGFKGGAATDCFQVALCPAVLHVILDAVATAWSSGARTASGRHLGGFVEAWRECLDWQTGEHPRSPW